MTAYSHDCNVFSLFTSKSHPLSFSLAACANRAEWQANQRYRNLKKLACHVPHAWICFTWNQQRLSLFHSTLEKSFRLRKPFGDSIHLNRPKPFCILYESVDKAWLWTPSRRNSRLEERREGRGDLLHFCVNRNILWGTFGAKLKWSPEKLWIFGILNPCHFPFHATYHVDNPPSPPSLLLSADADVI